MSIPNAPPSSMPMRFKNSETAVAASATASIRLGNLSSVVSRFTIKRHGRCQSHRVRIWPTWVNCKSFPEDRGFNTLSYHVSRNVPGSDISSILCRKRFGHQSLDLRRMQLCKLRLSDENQGGATSARTCVCSRGQIDFPSSGDHCGARKWNLALVSLLRKSRLRGHVVVLAVAGSFDRARQK